MGASAAAATSLIIHLRLLLFHADSAEAAIALANAGRAAGASLVPHHRTNAGNPGEPDGQLLGDLRHIPELLENLIDHLHYLPGHWPLLYPSRERT